MNPRLAGYIMVLLGLLAVDGMTMATTGPLVIRGGSFGGPGTVTVQTGDGVSATWNIRTGTLEKALLENGTGRTELAIGPQPPSWFVDVDSRGLMPVQYSWRGYRITGDQVVLLHELAVPDGPSLAVEERPLSVVGAGGLLSLQRTFRVRSIGDGQTKTLAIVKRIRTGTPEGVTLPVKTDGHLQPLGPNDNLQADVIFRTDGPTVITTMFNGHWVDQPRVAQPSKESTP